MKLARSEPRQGPIAQPPRQQPIMYAPVTPGTAPTAGK